MNDVGYLPNGDVFNSGDNVDLDLSILIAGFNQGVIDMQPGGVRRLAIPSELGYGIVGNAAAGIGGTDIIIFDVTLNSFV